MPASCDPPLQQPWQPFYDGLSCHNASTVELGCAGLERRQYKLFYANLLQENLRFHALKPTIANYRTYYRQSVKKK